MSTLPPSVETGSDAADFAGEKIGTVDPEDDGRGAEKKRRRTSSPGGDDASRSPVSYKWLDIGRVHTNGRIYHDGIVLKKPTNTLTIRVFDTVELWGDEFNSGRRFCRVESLYFDDKVQGGNPVQFAARFFFQRDELVSLFDAWNYKNTEMLSDVGDNELVLSEFMDDNDIATIKNVCQINTVVDKVDEADPSRPLFQSRFKLQLDSTQKAFYLAEWTNEHEGSLAKEAEDAPSPSVDDDLDSFGDHVTHIIQEGEGSTLRSDIMVGSKHQATVGPFVPEQKVQSRNPKLVWKPSRISEDDLQIFLDQLTEMHTDYLKANGWTSKEVHCPLPIDKAISAMRISGDGFLHGSSLSTASSLSATRNGLFKECDVDAILEVLHDNNYDGNATLAAVKNDLNRVTRGIVGPETEIFEERFRRCNGSLLMIAKSLAPTKSMQEVIDYFYRFKIPEKFRLLQEKKREQAVRIVECIERRHPEVISFVKPKSAGEEEEKKSRATMVTEWSETAPTDVIGAVEKRKQSAEDLLREVQNVMGSETLLSVMSCIRELQTSNSTETRDELLRLLETQPELQRRFLLFLPVV